MPLGRRHKGPSDALDAEVAVLIDRARGDTALEELLRGCYRPQDADDPVGALQQAADLLDATHELQKKLRQALKSDQVRPAPGENSIDAAQRSGLFSAAEAQSLHAAEQARRKVIDVDDFSQDELKLSAGKVR